MLRYLFTLCCCVCAMSYAGQAIASVVISGTRVVFSSEEKEVTIKLANEGKTPSLVQVWLDHGNRDAAPGDVKVPFVLTPPLFRLDPGKGQTLRMRYTNEALPTDRESVFWLNVLEIPPKGTTDKETESHLVQMAFRSRIKVFYRPEAFNTHANLSRAYAQIHWTIKPVGEGAYRVEATNPTPYFMTITKVQLTSVKRHVDIDQGGMIAPFEKKQFTVNDKKGVPGEALDVVFSLLNDYGSEVSITSSIS